MTHKLPELPYAYDALNPYISRQTLEFHHGKHVQAYVNNLNNLIPGTPFEDESLETIIREADGGIYNNGAQVWNHTFYFSLLSAKPKAAPEGELLRAIEAKWSSFEAFRDAFAKASATLFGSGWAWLTADRDGKLEIVKESNAGNPLRSGLKPLLTCDVWEHAYYLDYQNRRPDYISEFMKIIDWAVVEDLYVKR